MRIPGESRFPRHRREDGTAKPDVFQISSEKVRGLKIKTAALPNSVKNSGKQLMLTRSLIAGLASLDIEAISLETDARVVKELASYSYLVFVVETDFSGHLPSNIELLLSRGDVKGKNAMSTSQRSSSVRSMPSRIS